MPVIHITPGDLIRLRFAYRPLVEIPFSYRVLISPEYQSPHRRWVEDAYRALHDVDLPHLNALIAPHGFIPDFLTPTPLANGSDIEADFEQVLATPDPVIRQNVQWLIQDIGESEMRLYFIAHPREAVRKLVEELRIYWQRTLALSWSKMRTILEGDILYRGRLMALDGADHLIPDLHHSIAYSNNQIDISPTCNHAHCPHEVSLCGDGIQLVPMIFNGAGRAIQITPGWHPMIGYTARGIGLYQRETRASKPLELALGAGRASVLQSLTMPASTGELAQRLMVTSGAVSQHLKRLMWAGLVESHRSGKRIYYRLTKRGVDLIALFDRTL
jgi:DNA-binding transcriptional ArsR family regulator